MADLTQDKLKAVLLYEPETGAWIRRRRCDIDAAHNAKFAGKSAGGVDPDTGYLRIRIDDTLYYAHRLAFLYMTGSWPADQVDHKNLDRADCRWDNLREASNVENNANKPISRKNTSGFKGVSFDKGSGRWVTNLKIDGRRFRRYGFKTPEEASAAYLADVAKHGTAFHRTSRSPASRIDT